MPEIDISIETENGKFDVSVQPGGPVLTLETNIGPPGAPGTAWLGGAGVPDNSLGRNGDRYLRTNGDVYAKSAGSWGTVVQSLKGPAGADGTDGSDGIDGQTGSLWFTGSGAPNNGTGSNGDFYLRSSNGDYYQKSGGVWGSPAGNLKGVQGDKGDKGDTGDAGTTDHGLLIGLSDDDHPQYLTQARGDARYYTESESDTALALKVDKISGKGLSTEDYSTAEKSKLAGIATGATAYTDALAKAAAVDDTAYNASTWNEVTDSAPSKNAVRDEVEILISSIAGKALASDLSTHIADTGNPHSVTKTQVGLSAVSNDAQLKIASNLSDLNSASTARTNLGLGTAAVEAAATLLARGNHTGTQTAATISDFSSAAKTATVNDTAYNASTWDAVTDVAPSKNAVRDEVEILIASIAAKALASDLSTHIADTANPHVVTKTQIGLSAVTNDAQLKIASNLSDLASASSARTNLGLGTAAVADSATLLARANHTGTQLAATISDFSAAAKSAVVSDTAYNASSWDAVTDIAPSKNTVRDQVETMLTSIAAKALASDLSTHVADTGNPHATTKTQVGLSAVSNDAQLKIASNLSDLNSASTARTNLGLGTAATHGASELLPSGGATNQIANKSSGTDFALQYNHFEVPRVYTFALALGTPAQTGTNLTNAIIIPTGTHRINKAWIYAKTAPTGAALIYDINLNGTTIWATQGNRIQLAAASQSANQTSFDTTVPVAGDLMTVDCDQIGSTLAGQDVTIEVEIMTRITAI